MAPAPWTTQRIAGNLLREGTSWWQQTIAFGFPSTAPAGAGNEASGFSAAGAAQREAARLAVSLWDDLIVRIIVETNDGAAANIKFENSTTGVGYAHAYYPGSWGAGGSIWFNPAYGNLTAPEVGQWGFMTYLHELGHALGLSHPGNYNGSVRYGEDAPYAQDSLMYTLMSYFQAEETGADRTASDGRWHAPQTPMLHDVLAIQKLYGADPTTRGGDTVYGFNAAADREVFDFARNPHPVLCIWDGGGIDTLDLSGFAARSRIDLAQGAFSDCDGMTANIAIAYRTVIENAIGGASGDIIAGNAAANEILGRRGNDQIAGGGGADRLNGGAGADLLAGNAGNDVLWGGRGADRFCFQAANSGSDRIMDFTDGADRLRFSADVADAFADFTLAGNGSTDIVLTVAGRSILLHGAAAIALSAADFEFLA